MKLAIGINIFRKYDRQDHCISTLIKLSQEFPQINLYNITYHKDINEHPEFTHLPLLQNQAKDLIPESTSTIPIAKDFFDILSNQDCDYFMYLNSDTLPAKKLIKLILKGEYETYAVSRHEILPLENIQDDVTAYKIEIAGFDAWICKKQWWIDNRDKFKNYIVGNHLWDVDYAITMFKNSHGKLCNKEFFLAHEKHPIKWNDSTPEALHNARLFDQTSFHKQWKEFIWGNLINRQPHGQFLIPLDNEDALEKKFLK
jgi:hypothetical protein